MSIVLSLSVKINVKPRNGHHPYIQGQYLTGYDKQICVKNETIKRVNNVLEMLNNSSGRKIKKVGAPVKTLTPSIQGVWTPYLDIAGQKFDIKIVEV